MHIRRATLADTADMATVACNAMLEDEFVGWLCPYRRQYPYCFRANALHSAKTRVFSGATLLVMVIDEHDPEWDGAEKVISYLGMSRSSGPQPPPSLWDTINLKLNSIEAKASYYLRLDKSVNYDHLNLYITQGDIALLEPYKDNWEVEHLSVDNNFQRRGIGQKMVKAAQEIAARDKVPMVLLASVKGIGLYTKCGFKNLGEVTLAGLKSPAMVWIP